MKEKHYRKNHYSSLHVEIFENMISKIDCDYFIGRYKQFRKCSITNKLNIISFSDNDTTMLLKKVYNELYTKHSDKYFIICQEIINMPNPPPNVYIITVPDIIAEREAYNKITSVKKNINSTMIGLALNKQPRIDRILSLSILFGLGLDKNTIITNNDLYKHIQQYETILSRFNWDFDNYQDMLTNVLKPGYERLRVTTPLPIKSWTSSDRKKENISNFNVTLKNIYENSFVEVVSETKSVTESNTIDNTYMESDFTGSFTEKTLHSIYAMNFLIMVNGVNSVKYLRDVLGIDVFDDVVDHSYDTYVNPLDRIYKAINDNKKLFTNPERTKQLWLERQDRFKENIRIVKEDMYDMYENYANDECDKALKIYQNSFNNK